MARQCMFSGKKTGHGRTRSHSMRQGKRKYKVNLLTVKLDLGDGVKVPVKIAASEYKKYRGFTKI